MWYSLKKKLFLIIFLTCPLAPLCSAAPNLKVESLPDTIAANQTATLTLQLEWAAAEDPYEINSLEPKYENLILVDQHQSQETGPVISHTITYMFRPVKKGTALIYPFEISYRKSEADPWSPLVVPEQKIRVVPAFPGKAILTGILILGGLCAAGFLTFRIRRIVQMRKAVREMPPPNPKQRLYANAEEAIATFASPDTKTKITHWANQLRTVVAAYYDAPSRTATGAELLAFLRSKGLAAGEWNEVSGLLEQLNEMQFSRADIPSYDLDRMQKTLLQYVRGKIIIENSNQ